MWLHLHIYIICIYIYICMYVVVYLCIMCKRTLYTSSGMRAYLLIRCLFTNNGREETQYFCSMRNPTGYSIGLGMFGGIPTFQPQTIKSMKSPWISAMFFLRQFQISPGQLKRLKPESAGMGVQPFLWRVPTSPCLRTPGGSTKLGLSARSSSSRWMQIQLSYAIFWNRKNYDVFWENLRSIPFFLGSNQRIYHKVSDP